MWLRILVFAIVIGAVYLGIRRIANDWRAGFKRMDEAARERDLRERQRGDVIDLTPDEDGVYRPGDTDKDQR